jgi:hypothetical protein
MTASDFLSIAGWFLLAWAAGYTSGFAFLSVRKVLEGVGV